MISAHDKEIQALVTDIRDGKLLLPEIQRPYVWIGPQVRNLFDSLYRGYPSGQLLVWETDQLPTTKTVALEELEQNHRRPQLLLDGQQRLTSLSAVMLGKPLWVRWRSRPIDIAFNIFSERFEVAGPRQRAEASWISLTKLFTTSPLAIFRDLKLDLTQDEQERVFDRLTRLDNIKKYRYRVIVLEALSYEEVTDIFVRINSGGTSLGSADLALAQMSTRWPGVTVEFEENQKKYAKHGIEIGSGLFLRAISLLLTGQTRLGQLFSGSRQVTQEDLEHSWKRVRNAMDQAIQFLLHNCGFDRLDMLPTNNVLIPLVAFFDIYGNHVTPQQSRELQRWTYMALIWGRYSSTVESRIDQDYAALRSEQPIANMIQNIEDQVGRRQVTERELQGQRKNSAYMVMAYVLARRSGAQDWFNGLAIGSGQALELHHIFPKKLLSKKYRPKQDSVIIDQIANLAFLSGRTNGRIGDQSPADYLEKIDEQRLRAQYVPIDTALWTLDHYEDFVLRRRTLLADAINHLLQSLTVQPALYAASEAQILESRMDVIEHQLRDVVEDRLLEAWGNEAWERGVPKDIRGAVERRIQQRIEHNPYESEQHKTLAAKLARCQFSDFARIVIKTDNWPLFTDIFGTQDIFEQYNSKVTAARNAFKHNNELSKSDLVSAEAGLIWLEECLKKWTVSDMDEDATDEDVIDDAEGDKEGNI